MASPLKVMESGQWRAAPSTAALIASGVSSAMNEMAVPCGQGAPSQACTGASFLPRKQSGVSVARQPGLGSESAVRGREETVQPRLDSA